MMKGIKRTYEEVKKEFVDRGCILLTQEYINGNQYLDYIAKCGHKHRMTFNHFKRNNNNSGTYCLSCAYKEAGKQKKYSQEYVENCFKENGCELLDKYVNCHTGIKYKCVCGNIAYTTFSNFHNRGSLCMKCSGIIKPKYSKEYIEQAIKDNNLTILDSYENLKTPVRYVCACGNIATSSIYRLIKKKKCCKKCLFTIQKNHPRWNPDREYVKLNRRITSIMMTSLRRLLRSTRKTKNDKCELILGYSRLQLLEHLSKDPNFEFWKNDNYNWQIDHIYPIIAFIHHRITDPKIINALDNLRIITAKENLSKSGYYIKEDFLAYLNSKNISLPQLSNQEQESIETF